MACFVKLYPPFWLSRVASNKIGIAFATSQRNHHTHLFIYSYIKSVIFHASVIRVCRWMCVVCIWKNFYRMKWLLLYLTAPYCYKFNWRKNNYHRNDNSSDNSIWNKVSIAKRRTPTFTYTQVSGWAWGWVLGWVWGWVWGWGWEWGWGWTVNVWERIRMRSSSALWNSNWN